VGHETRLYPHLSIRENLIFAARMCDVRQPAHRADQLLQGSGLRPHADRFPVGISRGMCQRVAILRALVHDPRIVLLDEPFSGLDEEATDWLLRLLEELRARRATLCLTTHDRQRAEQLADRVLSLRSGRAEELRATTGASLPANEAREEGLETGCLARAA
jgi:ABC-type multidrug transport system ATPase subunit